MLSLATTEINALTDESGKSADGDCSVTLTKTGGRPLEPFSEMEVARFPNQPPLIWRIPINS
jgi:hypothetical protein